MVASPRFTAGGEESPNSAGQGAPRRSGASVGVTPRGRKVPQKTDRRWSRSSDRGTGKGEKVR
jgi:hypothetical protein